MSLEFYFIHLTSLFSYSGAHHYSRHKKHLLDHHQPASHKKSYLSSDVIDTEESTGLLGNDEATTTATTNADTDAISTTATTKRRHSIENHSDDFSREFFGKNAGQKIADTQAYETKGNNSRWNRDKNEGEKWHGVEAFQVESRKSYRDGSKMAKGSGNIVKSCTSKSEKCGVKKDEEGMQELNVSSLIGQMVKPRLYQAK